MCIHAMRQIKRHVFTKNTQYMHIYLPPVFTQPVCKDYRLGGGISTFNGMIGHIHLD